MKTGLIALITIVSVLTYPVLTMAGEGFPGGPYLGQEPPQARAKVFAPGLIGEDEWVGTSGFLAEGEVFVYSAMKGDTDWRFKQTYVMYLRNGEWTKPEIAPFSEHVPYNFTVGPGGKTIYFTSLKSPDKTTSQLLEQSNIWAVSYTVEGWTEPVMLGPSINTIDHYENYPAVAKDGTVYYMSRREDTLGKTDIYRSRNVDGRYAAAENVGAPINSAESDQDPFVAPDGSYLIVCLTGRDDSVGKYDLYVSFADEDGSWSAPVSLGMGVNTPGSEFRPYVSRDGKYLFFTSLAPEGETGSRIFWVSTSVIQAAREQAAAG